jgi:hypothetical protein
MNIATLQKLTSIIDDETGEAKVNIAIPPFMISRNVRMIKMHYVNQSQQMRPDLISFMYYGTSQFIDIILKANGISNPFCIKEGMFLMIPERSSTLSQYKPIKKNLKPRTNFDKVKRVTPVDKKRLEFLAGKSSTKNNGSSENLPPNMLKTGQKAKDVKTTSILLGAHLGVNKPETFRNI